MLESIDIAYLTRAYALPWLINISAAILILLIGRFLVRVAVRIVRRIMGRAKVDPTLIQFTGSVIGGLLFLIVIIAAVDRLGVDTTSFIALIGAAGLAVGLALQNSLSNFAAGIMLILFKPFKVGDYIEAADTAGSVKGIQLFSTLLNTPDNRLVIVPNGAIYSNTIVNYSALPTRRIDLIVRVAYGNDLAEIKNLIARLMAEDERILKDPAPIVRVADLTDAGVELLLRPWVEKDNYWAVRWKLMEGIKLAFDEKGFSFALPRRDIHLRQSGSP